jgi:hypothetical protein
VLLPAGFSLALVGLYFCGVYSAQNLVAPTLEGMSPYSWREFGALELLQDFVLLCVFFYLLRCFMMAQGFWLRLFICALAGLMLFVFLEEIDYGAHFLEMLTGNSGSLSPDGWDRNLHNRTLPSGEQVASYIKLGGNILVLAGFVVAPLALGDSRNRTVRLLVPSKWVIATVALTIAIARLAHVLDDAGFGIINDQQGNLHLNISEFRELLVYYLFLVYAAILHERLVARQDA